MLVYAMGKFTDTNFQVATFKHFQHSWDNTTSKQIKASNNVDHVCQNSEEINLASKAKEIWERLLWSWQFRKACGLGSE